MIANSNKKAFDPVHALWIGKSLSLLELLTIKSFIRQGFTFNLWTYNNIKTPVPHKVVIRNANHIIPYNKVFQYKNLNQFGHGKGSYAGFSDIFRYKLLYEYGGWWTDMDVTCLKPLYFKAPYVFRTHHDMKVVGNIMKCPPKSELMLRCYHKAVAEVNADNRDWNKPIRILNEAIEELGLQKYIVEMSNRDSWNDVRKLITGKKKVPDHWYVIHWVNEEWRRNGINKDYSGKNSVLRNLYEKYQVPVRELPIHDRLKNRLKLSFSLATLKYAWTWGWGHAEYYLKRRHGNGK
jgi:hypothetical protein